MCRKHLNRLKRVTQKDDRKNNFLLLLLFLAILTDVCGPWFANVLFSNDDAKYWDAFFLFQSLESFFFALVFLKSYKLILNRSFARWVVESWFAICLGDFLDNLFGNRYEVNIFDCIALGCIVSSLINILWNKYVLKL